MIALPLSPSTQLVWHMCWSPRSEWGGCRIVRRERSKSQKTTSSLFPWDATVRRLPPLGSRIWRAASHWCSWQRRFESRIPQSWGSLNDNKMIINFWAIITSKFCSSLGTCVQQEGRDIWQSLWKGCSHLQSCLVYQGIPTYISYCCTLCGCSLQNFCFLMLLLHASCGYNSLTPVHP